jgi:hypothetical protein
MLLPHAAGTFGVARVMQRRDDMRTIGGVFWIGGRGWGFVAAEFSEDTQYSLAEDAAFLSSELMAGLLVYCEILLLASIDVDRGVYGLGVEAG